MEVSVREVEVAPCHVVVPLQVVMVGVEVAATGLDQLLLMAMVADMVATADTSQTI